jgi:hypothetical protein
MTQQCRNFWLVVFAAACDVAIAVGGSGGG